MTGGVVSVTVKLVVQVVVLPARSATVMTTGNVPTPTAVPAGSDCTLLRAYTGVLLSVACTLAAKFGTVACPLALAAFVSAGAQTVMTGGVVSITVNPAAQLTVLLEESAMVISTGVVPTSTIVPTAGFCVRTNSFVGVQVSVTRTKPVMSGTAASPVMALATLVTAPAQAVMTGGVVSSTVMLVPHIVALPEASWTVIVTNVVPAPTNVPGAGTCVMTNAFVGVLLSVACTALRKSGTAIWQLALAGLVTTPAQAVITGGVVSMTTKLAVQVAALLTASRTTIVMLVVPTPTTAPAIGD